MKDIRYFAVLIGINIFINSVVLVGKLFIVNQLLLSTA